MNIDELKSNWNSMDVPPAYHGENVREILSRVESGRVSTLRDRLSGISRGLMAMCMAGLIIMIPYFSATPTLAFFAVCFFVFLGAMHFRMYKKIRRLNFSQMTVKEAMTAVCIIDRDRMRQRAIGIALAIPLAFSMCLTFWNEYGDYTLYGCIAGAVIGLTIGLTINRRAVAIIREMKQQLG